MLAADRATKSVIIIVLQCIFIASVGVALLRTAAAADSSASSDTVFINVEAHSIAFSAQYLWIIPAVILASIIGVSQTEAAIPNILRRLKDDLNEKCMTSEETTLHLDALDQHLSTKKVRIFGGGVPSWKPLTQAAAKMPSQWRPSKNIEDMEKCINNRPSYKLRPDENVKTAYASEVGQSKDTISRWSSWRKLPTFLPYFIVVLGTAAGMTVSALVPPDGFDCRNIAQLAILFVWLASAQLDALFQKVFPITCQTLENRSRLFWCTFVKDLLATSTTIGCVIATQLGIMNRCSCYTRWGTTGLKLPEMPDVAAVLSERLGREYPLVTFAAIVIELVIVPLSVWLWYEDAMRVFVQRDDDKERTRADTQEKRGNTLSKTHSSSYWICLPRWRRYRLAGKMTMDICNMKRGQLFKTWIYWLRSPFLRRGGQESKGSVTEGEIAVSLQT